MFDDSVLIFGGIEGDESRFHIFAHGLILGDTEGVGYCFHVLRSRTYFRRYRGHRVPLSCLALPDSF
jgi:hypothetical protein